MTTLYAKLIAVGCKVDNHESDLYVQSSQIARDVIAQYNQDAPENAVKFTVFTSNLDGDSWLELPFMYAPYWEDKQRKI